LTFPNLFSWAGSSSQAGSEKQDPASSMLGTEYYVDGNNGSDSNPGTSRDFAWQTIQKAADSLAPGDRVTVLSGTYNQRVQITHSGAAGATITYQAEGKVTLKGFTVRADYITIKGFEITNTDDVWDQGWGIFIEGSECLIEENYVYDATRGGIALFAYPGNESSTNNCVVRNNRLYHNAMVGIDVSGRNHLIEENEIWGTIQYHPKWLNPPVWVDADGIRFFGSGHTLRKNYIHDISFRDPENVNPHIDCFQTWSGSSTEPATNILIERNHCINLEFQTPEEAGQGFMIEDASELFIINNIIQPYHGIHAINSNRLLISNNTFESSLSLGEGTSLGIILSNSPNCQIKNNIFGDFGGRYLYADAASQAKLDVGFNLVFRTDGNPLSGVPYPNDLWDVNPHFVNPAEGDYHLSPSSEAVDAGTEIIYISNDMDGNPRPSGMGYDMGAYEMQKPSAYLPFILIASP
jgi:hypothetical protein